MGDVLDHEWLHRCVRVGECQSIQPAMRLSSTAFNDKSKKPSVDRAGLRAAEESKKDVSDGIVRVLAEKVRQIGIPIKAPDPPHFQVDVWGRALPENPAHAQIEPLPNMTGSRFDKLKEALTRLAEKEGWVIEPTPP